MRSWLISWIGYITISVIGRTMRWQSIGDSHLDDIYKSGKRAIFTFWHGRIFPATYYWRNRGIVVMTSMSRDGEPIAQCIQRFGFGAARGSSSAGWLRALAEMSREIRNGRDAAFTVDGPRGPARVSQPGAVWLAKASGHPVLPFHCEADRFWTLRSWDRTQIPKPFATVAISVGEPFYVPRRASETEVEQYRQRLDTALAAAEESARRMLTRSQKLEVRS